MFRKRTLKVAVSQDKSTCCGVMRSDGGLVKASEVELPSEDTEFWETPVSRPTCMWSGPPSLALTHAHFSGSPPRAQRRGAGDSEAAAHAP